MRDRRQLLALGSLVAVVSAVALAAVVTPAPHTGGDNAAYLSLAHSLVSGKGYTELWDPALPPHTKYPPLFPLALGAMMLAGASTWVAFKLFAAVSVGAAVLLIFVWAARRVGELAAAAIAVLTLLSGGWLEAGRWILSEPLFLVLTFLALWALEGPGRTGEAEEEGPAGIWGSGRGWLAVGGAAALLAFFTRSAGLPLVLAALVALLLARRFRAAALFAVCFGIAGGLWLLRARIGGAGAYQSEFWMVNPYQPELGTIGWLDLPARVWANLQLYVGTVLPGEWWPSVAGPARVMLGILLAGPAVWGWAAHLRRPSAAELFLPLYLGLILIWPEVWSGDRFALPLYPLVLVYGGETIFRAARRVGEPVAFAALAAAFLAMAAPTLPRWAALAGESSRCRRAARGADPIVCDGVAFQEFRYAAAWAGQNLPAGSVVLNRKPRIHYLLGGPPGRTFPFTRDPAVFLAEADRVGARYVLLDHVDGLSFFYIPAVIQARPGAFCHVIGWGGAEGVPGTDLFGILPPEERRSAGAPTGLARCPASYRRGEEIQPVDYGARVPRLAIDERPSQGDSSAPPSP